MVQLSHMTKKSELFNLINLWVLRKTSRLLSEKLLHEDIQLFFFKLQSALLKALKRRVTWMSHRLVNSKHCQNMSNYLTLQKEPLAKEHAKNILFQM